MLELSAISHTYQQGEDSLTVLENISFAIAAGKMGGLLGASGSGKSTLLHIAGLLERQTSGEVLIDNVKTANLSEKQRTKIRGEKIGFVYQAHHLLPDFTALENVMMPLLLKGISKKQAIEKATPLLQQVGLQHRLQHRPAKLSGGEQQRVAIARALVHQPKILLADEPTGNLDPATAQTVFDILLRLVQEQRVAMLVATHNMELAARMDAVYRVGEQ